MKKEVPEIFVGIDIAYDDTDSIFKLAEEVEGYVNLIVIGSINVTFNAPKLTIARAKLTMICNYLYNKGCYFILLMHPITQPEHAEFFQKTVGMWGDRFFRSVHLRRSGRTTNRQRRIGNNHT